MILECTKNCAVGDHQRIAADDILKDTEEQPGCTDEQDCQQCESPRFGVRRIEQTRKVTAQPGVAGTGPVPQPLHSVYE